MKLSIWFKYVMPVEVVKKAIRVFFSLFYQYFPSNTIYTTHFPLFFYMKNEGKKSHKFYWMLMQKWIFVILFSFFSFFKFVSFVMQFHPSRLTSIVCHEKIQLFNETRFFFVFFNSFSRGLINNIAHYVTRLTEGLTPFAWYLWYTCSLLVALDGFIIELFL